MMPHKVDEQYQKVFDELLYYSVEQDKVFDKGVDVEVKSFTDSTARIVSNIRAYIANRQAMAMAIHTEIGRLEDLERGHNKKVEWLKKYTKDYFGETVMENDDWDYRYNLK